MDDHEMRGLDRLAEERCQSRSGLVRDLIGNALAGSRAGVYAALDELVAVPDPLADFVDAPRLGKGAVTDNVSQNPVVDVDGGLLTPSVPDATVGPRDTEGSHEAAQHGDRPSEGTGYVGDHADKLSRIAPMPQDEDERSRREDMQSGRTVFNSPWWAEALPRFLRGGTKRARRH